MQILAMFTCYNRKDKTEKCIKDLVSKNKNCEFTFVVADDNSNDGTKEILTNMKNEYDIHLLNGDGNLFYSGGMRLAMEYGINNLTEKFDYILMMNDDVEFYENSVEAIINQSKQQDNAVIVGAMCDNQNQLSYNAIKYVKGIKYRKVELSEWTMEADTFNANCVLIPYYIFKQIGVMDKKYIHSLGDFDYGLSIKKVGYKIYCSKDFVGLCNNNPSNNTWTDKSLSIKERIKKKENIKGAPFKQWWHFLYKNFGVFIAVKYSITPYIRILLRK
ncbi:MAG: glycosyltransferase family 2 protein [Clostridia bacterium]